MSVAKMLQTPYNILTRELDIFLAFSWRDWSASIIPGFLFSIGAMRTLTSPHPLIIFQRYLLLTVWLTVYIYLFDLWNQIPSIEEDRINKPDRPLPSGKLTIAGAKTRWALSLGAFLSTAVYEPYLLVETITWVLITALLCATPFGNHWLVKNCIGMSTGGWALLRASWKAIAPLTPQANRHVLGVCFWAGLLTHIQDFRDVKGDITVGRKTLPIAVGNSNGRRILTFFLMPVALVGLWIGDVLPLAPYLLVAAHAYVGYRLLQEKGGLYDHKTYMMYTYIWCLMLTLTALEGIGTEWIATAHVKHLFMLWNM